MNFGRFPIAMTEIAGPLLFLPAREPLLSIGCYQPVPDEDAVKKVR